VTNGAFRSRGGPERHDERSAAAVVSVIRGRGTGVPASSPNS